MTPTASDHTLPPFQSLLHTDYIARADQLPSIEEIIASHQCKDLVRQAIEEMEEQEILLDANIRAHQAMLSQSIIRRIPLEVLGLIFAYAMGETQENRVYFHRRAVRVPIRLSQVCQRWRRAALLQSDLWSRLRLTSDLPWEDKTLLALLSLFLDRSGDLPLHISIEDKSIKNGMGSDDEPAEEYVQSKNYLPAPLLEKHSRRIKQLIISLYSESPVWRFLETTPIHFPSLLMLHILHSSPRFNELPSFNILSACSSLSKLVWGPKVDNGTIMLPMRRVSCMEIWGTDLHSRYGFLNQATNLRQLGWYFHEDARAEGQTDMLILPNLRHFKVHWVPSNVVESELPFLRFPQLETISELDIKSFCACPSFVTTNSLLSLALVFEGAQWQGSLEVHFSKHVQELLNILPNAAPNLKHFGLSFDPQEEGSASPAHEDIDRGFIILIESMLDQNQQHFTSLETLSLHDITLPALCQILLQMVQEHTMSKLKEMELLFHKDTPLDSLLDFNNQMGLAVRETGLRVTIGARSREYYRDSRLISDFFP